jgi:ATP-dependent protease ClpP protease subunit
MNKPLARAHAALQALARPERADHTSANWKVHATAESAVVHIYDEIGGFGVSASELVPELAGLDAPEVEVRLNSPGGDYFDGVAIANALAEHPARVVVHVDGLAASAASVIAMAGDEVVMHPGSRMMIHDALTLTVGNAGEHARAAELLDGVSQDIAALYASRADWRSADGWREAMKAETWFGAGEAVQNGLATREVSRETSPVVTPVAAAAAPQFAELLAQWRSLAPQTPSAAAEVVTPEPAPQVSALPLSELLCSAYREDVS